MNERPDAVFVAVRSEQDDPGLRPRDGEFNPASSLLEMLIGENAEAQLFGVELESPILVPHRNPQEFDSLNHVSQECQHAANRNQLPTIKSRETAVIAFITSPLWKSTPTSPIPSCETWLRTAGRLLHFWCTCSSIGRPLGRIDHPLQLVTRPSLC